MHARVTFIEDTEKRMPITCLPAYRMILDYLHKGLPLEQMRGFQEVDSSLQVIALLRMHEVNKEYIEQNKVVWTPDEQEKIKAELAFVDEVRLGTYSISVSMIDDYGAMCFDAQHALAVLEHGFILQRLDHVLSDNIDSNSSPKEEVNSSTSLPYFHQSLSFWKSQMANRWRSATPTCPVKIETDQDTFAKHSEFWQRRR